MKKWSYCWAGRHGHINENNDSIHTKMIHLKIILSITFKVSIASNKRKWTNSLIARCARHATTKQPMIIYALTWPTCRSYCQLHSRTKSKAIRGNLLKMNKWSYCCARQTHLHENNQSSIHKNLTHLIIILSFTLKVSIVSNKKK